MRKSPVLASIILFVTACSDESQEFPVGRWRIESTSGVYGEMCKLWAPEIVITEKEFIGGSITKQFIQSVKKDGNRWIVEGYEIGSDGKKRNFPVRILKDVRRGSLTLSDDIGNMQCHLKRSGT